MWHYFYFILVKQNNVQLLWQYCYISLINPHIRQNVFRSFRRKCTDNISLRETLIIRKFQIVNTKD